MCPQTYEERQAKLDALKKAREKQKEANGNTPKYHETENRVIDLPQKTIITKVEYIKEVEYVPAPSKSLGTYVYENIIPITLVIGGGIALGYNFKNEIYNFFAANRNNVPATSPFKAGLDEKRLEVAFPKKLFDDNIALTRTERVITFLKKNEILTEAEIESFRLNFPKFLEETNIQYEDIIYNYNRETTIKDHAEFNKIFSDAKFFTHQRIKNLNINPKIITKTIGKKGISYSDKIDMYDFINKQGHKFVYYLILKMVYSKKIEDLNQADNNDVQTLDMHLTDYELSANEEVSQAETCPNVDIYSKQALLLDPQELPTWEMLGEEAICVHTLTDKQEEVVSNAQIVDDIEDFIIEITPSSLVEKAVLAYEPGTCSTIMGSLNMFVQTSGLQHLINGVINSGANPYIALVNSIAIPLAQNMLISQACNKVEQLFEEQTFSIAEKMVNKLLEKQLLLGIEDKSSDQEAYADETLDTTIPEMHFFVQENNSCPNTTLNSFNVFEQPDIAQGEHYIPIEVVSAGSFFD